GFVMAWRFATWPTRISPSLVNATTEGVRRLPSWLGMTTGLSPSITATTELVVPRSMPITLPMPKPPACRDAGRSGAAADHVWIGPCDDLPPPLRGYCHRISRLLPGLDASLERLGVREAVRTKPRCLTGSRRFHRSGAIEDDLLVLPN